MIDVGRLCMKIAGREAGKICTVVKQLGNGFVLVTGPKAVSNVRRRKCAVSHIEPLAQSVAIAPDASDADVLAAYDKSGIYALLKLEKPTAEKLKAAEEAARLRKEAPKAEPVEKKPDVKKEEKKAAVKKVEKK